MPCRAGDGYGRRRWDQQGGTTRRGDHHRASNRPSRRAAPEARPAADRSFLRWGLALPRHRGRAGRATVWWLGGDLAYVLDDPAIHLSVADRLARDGTWGVVPGHFESASSSPLWTVLVGRGAYWSLARSTSGCRWCSTWPPAWRSSRSWPQARAWSARPPPARDALATVVLVTVVLFLPGLAVVGMEHTVHVALVLAAVLGVHRWALEPPVRSPAVDLPPCALAALTRFETAFVAVGLAVALVLVDRRRVHGPGPSASWWRPGCRRRVRAGQPGHGRRAGCPTRYSPRGRAPGRCSATATGPLDIAEPPDHRPAGRGPWSAWPPCTSSCAGRRPRRVPAVTLVVAAGRT